MASCRYFLNQWQKTGWIVAAFVLFLVGPTQASGQSTKPPNEKSALSDSNWYDSQQGKIKPVPVRKVVDDSINRESRWLPKAERVAKPKASTANSAGNANSTGGLFGTGLTLANLLGWMLLVTLFLLAVGILVYVFSKAEIELGANGSSSRNSGDSTPDQQTVERMKHLPAELRRTDVNLRSEAERLMNAGEYEQAVILLFGHQLLLLDRVGHLRLSRGKTNGKYVRETRAADPESASRLAKTVTAFERSYFGRHPLGRDEFAELWETNAAFERGIEGDGEVAA